jgi:hypothetical protein
MSARQIAISKALQELEPAMLDLARMSHLVSEHAESAIGQIEKDGGARLTAADADALLFGVYDLDHRIRQIRDAYEQAFKQAPPI